MVRIGFLAFGTAALFAAVPVTAQEAAGTSLQSSTSEEASVRLSLATEILAASYPPETQFELFQKTADQMEAQMLQSLSGMITDDGALAIVMAWQESVSVETDSIMRKNVPTLMEAWALAFADTYSETELRDILAFVSTHSGQAFMSRSTDILAHPAFAAANQAYIDETTAVVFARMPELITEMTDYTAAQERDAE